MNAQNLRVISMTGFLLVPGLWASGLGHGQFEARSASRVEAGVQVTISAEDCRRILRQAAEGDAAYLPGVDVRGRKVAPADLPSSRAAGLTALPERIVIDLETPLGAVTAGPPAGLELSKVGVGEVSIGTLEGDVRLNDQPVGAHVLALVREACRRAGVV
ncbi:MAG: hypothetical protein KIT81_15780 [Alphaproteobacteria bacterium]|nr:hypothetical protein [Alphaproteobacteria bacterium]